MDNEYTSQKLLPFPLAFLLSLWSGGIALFNGAWWFTNSWNLFATQGWGSFGFLISPACWLWFTLVASSWFAPTKLAFWVWRKTNPELTRTKVALIVFLVPLVATILFNYFGDYWYPLKIYPNGKTYLRIIPFL